MAERKKQDKRLEMKFSYLTTEKDTFQSWWDRQPEELKSNGELAARAAWNVALLCTYATVHQIALKELKSSGGYAAENWYRIAD